MGATFLDREGRPKPLIMGCYGIGVGRLLAAVIEAHHDEEGIVWPANLAPFQVVVSVLDPKRPELLALGEDLAQGLAEAGLEVLLDDRDQSAGEKFHDAKLWGIPFSWWWGRGPLPKTRWNWSADGTGKSARWRLGAIPCSARCGSS